MLRTLTLLVFILLPLSATAQEAKKDEKEKPPAVAATVESKAPYDVKMLRLSEVLGSIHYLRALCGAEEESKWRDVMSKLLAAEKPGPNRKARLIARFNRGYHAFDSTYSSCTASALLASERYTEEGALLANQIARRYGR
ncbi:MAG: TIGR02301 family protein [Rhizobiaceae bacterium]